MEFLIDKYTFLIFTDDHKIKIHRINVKKIPNADNCSSLYFSFVLLDSIMFNVSFASILLFRFMNVLLMITSLYLISHFFFIVLLFLLYFSLVEHFSFGYILIGLCLSMYSAITYYFKVFKKKYNLKQTYEKWGNRKKQTHIHNFKPEKETKFTFNNTPIKSNWIQYRVNRIRF